MPVKGNLGPLFLIILSILIFMIAYIVSHNAFYEEFTDITHSLQRKIKEFENQTTCGVGYHQPENLNSFYFSA